MRMAAGGKGGKGGKGGGGDDGDAAAAEAPKVLAYRVSLGVAALAITTAAVASILSSEGMPIAGAVADDAASAALLASALSIVLCSWASFDLPLLGWPVGGATFRAACFVPLAALGGLEGLKHPGCCTLGVLQPVTFFQVPLAAATK